MTHWTGTERLRLTRAALDEQREASRERNEARDREAVERAIARQPERPKRLQPLDVRA
jgi:hypothetical protein